MKEQIKVNCMEDNNFEQDRKILHCCYSEITLQKENIFYVETFLYGEEMIGQYYTICPNCGYMILLDESKLPEETKLFARNIEKDDPLLFRKNELRSQLIHLESITPKVKARLLW